MNPALAYSTVHTYSYGLQEKAMSTRELRNEFRLVYRPQPERLPRWVRQIWAWF